MKQNKLWVVLIAAVVVALFFVIVYPYLSRKHTFNKDRLRRHTRKYIHNTRHFFGLNGASERFKKDMDEDDDEEKEDFEEDEEEKEEFRTKGKKTDGTNEDEEEDEAEDFFQDNQEMQEQEVTEMPVVNEMPVANEMPSETVEGYEGTTTYATLVTQKPKLIY